MKVIVIGIDLGKHTFHLHGVDDKGKIVLKKKVSRSRLMELVAKLSPCLIGMEACAGAHHWGRKFTKLGHTVKLMAPQFVKPYVKTNKHDHADAEAICEAVTRPSMRFVPIKDIHQQDILSIHRVRERLISNRTALTNEIRSLLHEYGIIIRQGVSHLRTSLKEILAAEDKITPMLKKTMHSLFEELNAIEERIMQYNQSLEVIYQQDERCQRIATIPGVGKIIATAMVASIGNAQAFQSGRQLAAWLGVVPAQHSTGGKQQLRGISKRGDCYLRKLLIHGARSVVNWLSRKKIKTFQEQWIESVALRRGKNKEVVALANKMARIIWAVLVKPQPYKAQYESSAI